MKALFLAATVLLFAALPALAQGFTDLTYLTPDQQAQAQITCGGMVATLTAPLKTCPIGKRSPRAGTTSSSTRIFPTVIAIAGAATRRSPRALRKCPFASSPAA